MVNSFRTLRNEKIDVLDIKNGNQKLILIFPLFQCSDPTNSYSGSKNKGIQIRCVRQMCSIKREITLPVAIHDIWDFNILIVSANY